MNIKIAVFFFISCTFATIYCHEDACQKDSEGMPQIENAIKDNLKEDAGLEKAVLQGILEAFEAGSLCSSHFDKNQNSVNNFIYAWGIDCATTNGVVEKNIKRIPSNEEIDQTIAYFESKKLPFIWWSAATILESRGFQFGGTLTGIARHMSQEFLKPISPANLRVVVVESQSEIEAFSKINAEGANMSLVAAEQWKNFSLALMKHHQQVHFLAYLGEIPVGTVSLSTSPTVAGIWNLTTLPDYRRQGIGASLVYAALIEAKKRDYKEIMAVLAPKGMAWGLFTKLGFTAVSEFPIYIYGSSEPLEK